MNCKYCGAALPTKGGVCPECGRMIPVTQLKEMKQMLDPKWNMYRNKDTGFYKSNPQNTDNTKIGKAIVFIILIFVAIILIIILKRS